MLPIIPHFTSECLELNEFEKNEYWPPYDEKMLQENNVNIVIQINGKKKSNF